MTKKEIFVRDSSEFTLHVRDLWSLYKGGSKGIDGKGSEIDRAAGFLQRLAQTAEWTKNENAKCQEYINSLIKGSNLLDSFVVVPAPLLLQTVEDRIISTKDEIREAWEDVKTHIESRVNKGTKQFIIDGQNRLFESLVPFFDNKITLSSEHSLTICVDGVDHDCRGRRFKELNPDIQEYIKGIKVPFVVGTEGELERFCDTLIWKNEGVAWDEWQKMVTKNWFTKYLRQFREISDKDTTNPQISALLCKIAGKDYQYEKNGWDRIVSELLMWMVRGVQSSKLDEAKQFFEGNYKVTNTQISSLKKYLIEFGTAYSDVWKKGVNATSGGITNTELRNYIYLRYALDNPKKDMFKGLSVPNWKILKPTAFAKLYKKYNKLLMEDPVKFGELPNRMTALGANGKTLAGPYAGSYAHSNSHADKLFIQRRLEILFSVLGGRKPESKHVLEELMSTNVIAHSSNDKVPSMASIHEQFPYTPDGDLIDVMDYDDTSIFDIGHVNPKSKGGSNLEVVLQKKTPNRKLQDSPIPS